MMKGYSRTTVATALFSMVQTVALCIMLSHSPVSAIARIVKVGLFSAEPLVFERNGIPQGLFIDIVEHVARERNWHIEYVRNSWNELQKGVQSGSVDVLPAMGYTEERTAQYDFCRTPIFIENGVVFTSADFPIHSIYDLKNKRVAAVEGSIFTTGFIAYVKSFGIDCDIRYTTDNRQVMEAIAQGPVDAGVCIYSLGNQLAREFPVVITPVSFSPIALCFAVKKGANSDVIAAVDSLVSPMLVDPNSVYSRSFARWTQPQPRYVIPVWVFWGLGGLVLSGLLLLVWTVVLNRLVSQKTRHLNDEIAERKSFEVALRESRDRLQLAAESSNLGIWDWDIVNNQLAWDDRMFQLYGISDTLASNTVEIWKSSLHPDDFEYAWNECQAAVRGERPFDLEFRIQRPDGMVRFLKGNGMVIRDQGGTAVRMIGTNRDITGEKNAELEHIRYEQQIQLNSKLDSLGVLAGGIAHDFNNLMGGIYGYVELATKKSDNPQVVQFLNRALATLDRARALTQQLLTFAKGGNPVTQTGPLFPFVRETTLFALSGSNISCDFDVPDDLRHCNFDRNQIAQVFDNLVINAKQAMPSGGTIDVIARNVTVAHREHPLLVEGEYVRVSVKDRGIGMPDSVREHIFDPFFTTKPTGHGLGLATCHSIVRRHNGCIDVESIPGEGSTFHVLLPASMAETSLTGQRPPDASHEGKGTFLIMDDEPVLRETMGAMLELLGYTVISTEHGQEVVDCVLREIERGTKIAGVVVDLTIPGQMGGIEAAKRIIEINRHIPVFVVSGYAADPVMVSPEQYGFCASIQKPFCVSELASVLNMHLSRSIPDTAANS